MKVQFGLRHSGAIAKQASPESITTTGSMDSGPAHPSRLLPTWTMILPNSGKPEFGGASRNDSLHRHRVELVFVAHQLDMRAHRDGGADLVAAHDRHHHAVVLGMRFRQAPEIAKLRATERLHPHPRRQ